jgi:8-amino-7-oxononanoate synthase
VKQEGRSALAFLVPAIREAEQQGLLRVRTPPGGERLLCFCSNDYLNLAGRNAPHAACGAGSSRLVSGDRPVHGQLEEAAAALVGQESSLVFTSGYAANVGALSALMGAGDLIVSDERNHASIIDGARLSRARVKVAPHLEAEAVEQALREGGYRRALVATESYFSMDAETPDLRALRAICNAHNAIFYVDEAHALGVLGPEGRGLCADAGVLPDVAVGTFGKAFGAAGAFVSGCAPLATWLWNRARSFVFSTGLAPMVAAAALSGIECAGREPVRRETARLRADQLRKRLEALGIRPRGSGHIIPWIIGDPSAAVEAAAALASRGIDVRAIRPPSVERGTARLRFTVGAAHTESDIDKAAEAVAWALGRGLSCAAG